MEDVLSFIIIIAGARSTFILAQYQRIGPIRASCLLTLLFVSVVNFIPIQWPDASKILFFGGSFIGMSGIDRLSRYTLPLSCLIFYFYFFNLAPQLQGIGGALGLGAFLSVIPIALVNFAFTYFRKEVTQ